jgi:hypothetical protein
MRNPPTNAPTPVMGQLPFGFMYEAESGGDPMPCRLLTWHVSIDVAPEVLSWKGMSMQFEPVPAVPEQPAVTVPLVALLGKDPPLGAAV